MLMINALERGALLQIFIPVYGKLVGCAVCESFKMYGITAICFGIYYFFSITFLHLAMQVMEYSDRY